MHSPSNEIARKYINKTESNKGEITSAAKTPRDLNLTVCFDQKTSLQKHRKETKTAFVQTENRSLRRRIYSGCGQIIGFKPNNNPGIPILRGNGSVRKRVNGRWEGLYTITGRVGNKMQKSIYDSDEKRCVKGWKR
jgi:hypothetical protein